MKLLALDTSTDACSVALDIEGQVCTRFALAPRRHAEIILPMIEELLSEAEVKVKQLDAIAFGRGPGSFTGLRVACGVTQGIAFSTDLPVVPVSTLAGLAQGAYRATGHRRIIAAIDARMDEVYWGLFQLTEGGLMQATSEEQVSGLGDLELPRGGDLWAGVGSGWGTSASPPEGIQPRLCHVDPQLLPDARDILALAKPAFLRGAYVAASQALPTYLRNKVV